MIWDPIQVRVMENHAKRGSRSDNQKGKKSIDGIFENGAKTSQGELPKVPLWSRVGKVIAKVLLRSCFWEARLDQQLMNNSISSFF